MITFLKVALQCLCLGREQGLQLSFVHVAQSLAIRVVPSSMSWSVVAVRWRPGTVPAEVLADSPVIIIVLLLVAWMDVVAAIFIISVSAVQRPNEGAVLAAGPARPLLVAPAFAFILWPAACALGAAAAPGPRIIGVTGIAPVTVTATVVVPSTLIK